MLRWQIPMKLFVSIVLGLATCAPLSAQTPDPEAGAREMISRLANVQIKWGPSMNSPGVVIYFKEVSERNIEGHRAIVYRLFGTGFPKGTIFETETASLDLQVRPELAGVTLDDSGQAICAGRPGTCGDPAKPNDPIDFVMVAGKGEPKRFSLISEDGAFKAFTFVVPFPITGKDRGCSVQAILLLQHAEAVLIHGTGFGANSAIHHNVVSDGEKQEGETRADQNGELYEVELAGVKGQTKGKGTVTFHSQDCSPSLSYEWGQDSYQLQ
jgi:hypothetical protein